MGLDLGTISGVIGLDSGPFNKTLADTEGKLKSWASTQASEAAKGGEEGGKRFADGWGKKALVLLGGAGLAVAAAFTATLAKGLNLEPATDKVAASLGLTQAEADRVSRAAGKVYSSNWGESMEDAASRTGIVVSSIAGMRTASETELAQMTGLFSAFSDGFEIDMGRSTQVVGQMVKSGLVKDTNEGLDLLTAALQKVPVNVREDVMDAVDEYGPFMQTLGISGEQAMNMLASSAEKGMYGIDKTGDALKEFTIRATDMSATSKVGYDILGLSQEQMSKSLLKGGAEGEAAFNKIITGLQNIEDPVKQSQAALALFGTPLEDLSVSEIPKFLGSLSKTKDVLGDTSGAAEKMADTMSGNATSNIQTFMRTIETGAVGVLNEQLIPALDDVTGAFLRDWVPALQDAGRNLEGFGRWVRDNEGWLKPLAVAVTAFGAALVALGLVGYIASLGGLSGAFSVLSAKIAASTVVVYAKNAADLVASGASKALAAAQWLVNAAMSANPIGLVVIALAALAAGLVFAYNNSEDFRRVVNGAFQAVGEMGRQLWNGFLAPSFRFIVNGFAGVMESLAGFLRALGRIPGFEWATAAANNLDNMAAAARRAADGIQDIPSDKKVTIGIHTVYTTSGVSPSGNTVYRTGSRGLFEADGGKVYAYAGGGQYENHTAQFARGGDYRVWAEPETEGEWYLPLAKSKRDKTIPMWLQAGRDLGVVPFANGGSGSALRSSLPSFSGAASFSAGAPGSVGTNVYNPTFHVTVPVKDLQEVTSIRDFFEAMGLQSLIVEGVAA